MIIFKFFITHILFSYITHKIDIILETSIQERTFKLRLFSFINPDVTNEELQRKEESLWRQKSRIIHPDVTNEENEELTRIPYEGEIKEALFSMGFLKAPGPDDMPYLFFKHYYIIFRHEVVYAVQIFFKIKACLNNSTTDLLLLSRRRTEGASKVDLFRPINLCNVVYKSISKIMTLS
jgi:hypothetical protein